MLDPTMQKLDAMRARCDAATPGPWEVYSVPQQIGLDAHSIVEIGHREVQLRWLDGSYLDANFIASARTDMPRLIAALRAVLEEHYPVGEESDCRCCPRECACGVWEYPCVTVKAIAEALGVEA